MLYRLAFCQKRSRRRLRLVNGGSFGIELERNNVSEVVLLHRGANLEADLKLGATYELALNQAAILRFQRIGPARDAPSHSPMINP
jgi:hypothetical protein